MSEIWLPKNFSLDSADELGRTGETGDMAMSFTGHWTCPKCNEEHELTVGTSEEHGRLSTDQLEDIFGAQLEKDWKKHMDWHELVGSRMTPVQVSEDRDMRKHVSEALRDYWQTKRRLRESTNSTIHWAFE